VGKDTTTLKAYRNTCIRHYPDPSGKGSHMNTVRQKQSFHQLRMKGECSEKGKKIK
jgi:hypothetical protein